MSPFIYAALGGICWAFLGLCYKMADHRGCRPVPFTVAFMLVAALASAFLLPFERSTWNSPLLWILGGLVGIFTFLNIALLARTNTLGPASITWTMLNLGLLLPILLAPILFHEPLYLIDGLLLFFFLLMIFAFARSMATGGETQAQHLLPFTVSVIGIFLLEGVYLIGGKVKGMHFPSSDSASYSVIFYAVGAASAWLAHRVTPGYSPLRRNEWSVGMLAGITSSAGTIFFLAAMKLQAAVAFPMVLGISLLGGVLLTMILYKERFTAYKTIGLVLGFFMLLIATMRDQLIR